MKTKLITLLLSMCLLASCQTQYNDIPLVSNRNAKGRYITPACPTCSQSPDKKATIYHCPNGHLYSTDFK